MKVRFGPGLCIVLAACATACSSSDGGGGIPDAFDCTFEARADPYVAGIEKIGEAGTRVVLEESDPAPPARGDNVWTIEVYDDEDAPLDGLTVTATPFMPDHGHGTPIRAEVTPTGTTGEYEIAPVNLWMPGYWETTIAVDDDGALDDAVVFKFCIDP